MNKKRRIHKTPQPDCVQTELQLRELHWPEQSCYPLNHHEHPKQYAADEVGKDIQASSKALIITGFTSLAYIIDSFGYEDSAEKKVQIVFGFEPDIYRRKVWKQVQIEQEIADYWLDRGINPAKCGAVIKTIEKIKSEQLQFKVLKALHAKIYVTDNHTMLGSSNFSRNGLKVQHEANIRVGKNIRFYEASPFADMKAIAENFWHMAAPFDIGMIKLLEELVIVVAWQEALARAIAEVLEGHFLQEYAVLQEKSGRLNLWPTQWQGVAQAMQILQERGSVLIADPTGSGKTKMVSTLQLAVVQWLYATGRMDKTNAAVIAPPAVLKAWYEEQLLLERSLHEPVSQGILSNKTSLRHKSAIKVLQMANLLVMDEAHNYLRKSSNRSAILSAHNAEFVLLATATPINKQAKDLIRLVELLDPDNLGDEELAEFKRLYQKRFRETIHDTADLEQLRKFIWKFTLRRTKTQMNNEIKKERSKYRNRVGDECMYPEPVQKTYKTKESVSDVEIANKIAETAEKLKGLVYLHDLSRPKHIDLSTVSGEATYLQGRIEAAKGLSKYRVSAALRSSRAALIELVEGTQAAIEFLQIDSLFKKTGDILQKLSNLKAELPQLPFHKEAIPVWLKEQAAYLNACDVEIEHYKEIARLTKRMSDAREKGKAKFLASLLLKHDLVVAFDHTVISLHHFHSLLTEMNVISYIGAGGENQSGRQEIQMLFALGSKAKGIVALCSDAMSEGINLQAADVIVMLDMPSLLRLAEQRIGRIDRLDSPHPKILCYWPGDSPAFALRTDRNLYRTTELTKQMLQSNLSLPDELVMRFADEEVLKLSEVWEDLKEGAGSEEVMRDAFDEVRKLKAGDKSIITEAEYISLAKSRASVKCKVSYVSTHSNWAFFAMKGNKSDAPRWYFLNETGTYAHEYDEVCKLLREHLTDVEAAPPSESEHQHFIQLLRQQERQMLPNKKRRALEVAEKLLQRQLKAVKHKAGTENLEHLINDLLKAFHYISDDEVSIDWYQFAGFWLDVLRPILKAAREIQTKRKFFSLSDLDQAKYAPSFTAHTLKLILDNIPAIKPIEYRIAASIIGIKRPES